MYLNDMLPSTKWTRKISKYKYNKEHVQCYLIATLSHADSQEVHNHGAMGPWGHGAMGSKLQSPWLGTLTPGSWLKTEYSI